MKLAALLAAAVLALPAAAQQPASPFVGGRVGLFRPGGDMNVADVFDFGNGLDLEGFVGFPLTPNVALVGGIGYYATDTDTLSAVDPQTGELLSAGFEFSAIPITASVRAGGTFDRLSLYALAGVGIHLTTLELKATSSFQGSGSVSEDENAFGWHLGAGLAVAVTPRVSLGAEVRQTFAEASYPDIVGAFGPSDKLTLDGLRIGATLAFSL
jgi:opacity protein-like surface antigen